MKDYIVSKIKDFVYKIAPASYAYALGVVAFATMLFSIVRLMRFA